VWSCFRSRPGAIVCRSLFNQRWIADELDQSAVEALVRAVGRETLTVKSRQTFECTEPKKAPRIRYYPLHVVMSKTARRCVILIRSFSAETNSEPTEQ